MCTAAVYKAKYHYFGRNLDHHRSYGEQVVITPRCVSIPLRRMGRMDQHYALIGMAKAVTGFPLYYEATNEKGLSMAGLNFPQNSFYPDESEKLDNVPPFELIPWVLGQCADLKEARALLDRINLVNIPFAPEMPLSPLHWMISDREGSIVVESMKDGLHIYEDPAQVLTNNPPFEYHMYNLQNYLNLTAQPPVNRLTDRFELKPYSLGMGAIGLPGDLSSASRFVKVAFTRLNSRSADSESAAVSQFFHILGSVAQQEGCVHIDDEDYEKTLYTSCCNTDLGIYYYTTYENSQITAVDMHREDLDGSDLIIYPLITGQQIRWQN